MITSIGKDGVKPNEGLKINLQMFNDGVTTPEKTASELEAEIESKLRIKIRLELEEEARIKLAKEKVEALAQAESQALIEKVKHATANVDIVKKEIEKIDENIELSNLRAKNAEQADLLKLINAKLDIEMEEKKVAIVRNEILARIDKEPHLKNIVTNYLNKGKIKTIEDYDDLIDKELKDTLKAKWDLEEKNKSLGRDPLGNYPNGGTQKPVVDWKKNAESLYGADINRALGIR